ncbi:hypothetical protein GOP47_0010046 [Adiantum capillus-veneris]|uniref:Uncharacterized protein n=1 Tax=Adiantum capillus-veneris TaxID=13818 RepID=A0A9D4UU04_ADICA|nr:hypothetical protein GOP47_0010046 [Adiantum capillus-veneris]
MARRTQWAMSRFTNEQPPSKKTKKRCRMKDGSSTEEVQEVQVQELQSCKVLFYYVQTIMAQRTQWAMSRFTNEQPPSKKTKKRCRMEDGSSTEEVQVQERSNLVGSDNKDSESQKAIHRLAWNPSWAGR